MITIDVEGHTLCTVNTEQGKAITNVRAEPCRLPGYWSENRLPECTREPIAPRTQRSGDRAWSPPGENR